jgi:4-hydroxy-2-oxoheptanedioate aldolase
MRNTAKERMLAGKPAIGMLVGLGSADAAGLLAGAGFDFVQVDNQHGDWDDAGSLAAFRNICLAGCVPMARVRQNDFYAIGRLLDRGALGISVPMVETAEEAGLAARAMRYPPAGGRSAANCLMSHYGADYDRWINDEVFLTVQIEAARAAQHAEEILAVQGVDGCWIGPNDLARSMGINLKTAAGAAEHEAAIMSVLQACRKTGKIPGIHTRNLADACRWLERGFLFVTAGTDAGLLEDGAREVLRGLGRGPKAGQSDAALQPLP